MSSVTHPANEHTPPPGVPLSPDTARSARPGEGLAPPAAKAPVQGKFLMVATDSIRRSPFNPRDEASFDKADLAELAETIKEHGMLEPLLVRPVTDKDPKILYELAGGERRWRAAKLAVLAECPVILRAMSDDESLVVQIIENHQRKDLSPMEEANSFLTLQKRDPKKWTAAAIGRSIGRSDRFVSQRLALVTNLAPALRKQLEGGAISVEIARTLAPLPKEVQTSGGLQWAIRENDVDRLREAIFRTCIPESAAKFDVALYQGQWLEDGKKRRYFLDIAMFRTLQRKPADEVLAKVKKEWPDARFVEGEKLGGWVWADESWGSTVTSNSRPGDTAKRYIVPKGECTAIVWIAGNGEIKKAQGVCPDAALRAHQRKKEKVRTASQGRAAGPAKEPKDHKATRLAFNDAVARAAARKPDFPLRYQLFQIILDPWSAGFSPADVRKTLPAALQKFTATQADEGTGLWQALAALTPAQCDAAFRALLLTLTPAWLDHSWKDKPELMVAIAKSLDVTPPAIALPAPPAPKAEAKKETPKAKAAPKKKGKGK